MRTAIVLAAIVLWAPSALGQPASPAGAAPQTAGQSGSPGAQAPAGVKVESVWDFAVKGGPLMIPIALCSLVALTVIAERLLTLQRKHIVPAGFVASLVKVVDSAQDRQKGLELCQSRPSPLAAILAVALKRFGEPAAVVEKQMQDEGERQVVQMRKRLRLLSVVASIAPLLGLLGTITGMITAFQTVAASAEALGRTELLAKGIYEAMITTAAGLTIAIPVLIAYHGVSAKVDSLVHELDRSAAEFLDHLAQLAPAASAPAARRLAAGTHAVAHDPGETDGRPLTEPAVLAVAD